MSVLREAFHEAVREEAREVARLDARPGTDPPAGGVSIVRLMRLISVAFENARLLVERLDVHEPIELSLKLANIKSNVLISGSRDEPDEFYQAKENMIEFMRTYNPENLRVKSKPPAIEIAQEFVAAFGWIDAVDFVLTGIQEEAR